MLWAQLPSYFRPFILPHALPFITIGHFGAQPIGSGPTGPPKKEQGDETRMKSLNIHLSHEKKKPPWKTSCCENSINFTPKTSHCCLKKWYTRFSRSAIGSSNGRVNEPLSSGVFGVLKSAAFEGGQDS